MQKKIVKPLIKKSAEFNWLLGLLFVALGTAICEKANLGISMIAAPAFIIHEAVSKVTDILAVGHIEYMVQFVILLLTCAICKKFDWKYIFSFLTAVIYGLILNMWMAIFSNVTFNELWLRWIMFFVGNTCVCIGVALFFRTYMPHEAYELIVTEITKTYKFKAANVKWVYDIASLVVSLILALSLFGDVTTFEWGKIYEQSFHFIGLGTIIAAFISAPIINLFGKLFEYIFGTEPLIKPLHKFLESSKKKDENVAEETIDTPCENTDETNAQTNSANEIDVTIGPAETALTPEMAEEENSTNNEETPDSVEE
ncbi:MAG: hypothetical protein IKA59_01645 [Clostridia bacterium]|nr:hypothetical protein [Clostridia bacterium]